MRRDTKKYFEVHFGTFVRQTAREIAAACANESPLADLEGFLYIKKGHPVSFKPWIIPSHVMRERLTAVINDKN